MRMCKDVRNHTPETLYNPWACQKLQPIDFRPLPTVAQQNYFCTHAPDCRFSRDAASKAAKVYDLLRARGKIGDFERASDEVLDDLANEVNDGGDDDSHNGDDDHGADEDGAPGPSGSHPAPRPALENGQNKKPRKKLPDGKKSHKQPNAKPADKEKGQDVVNANPDRYTYAQEGEIWRLVHGSDKGNKWKEWAQVNWQPFNPLHLDEFRLFHLLTSTC